MDPWAQTSDPLLHSGYLTAYPRNPFAVPETVKAMQEQHKDPFRPGTEQSKFGARFGDDYTLMGQVLADFRYPKLPGQKMTQTNGVFYYADTEYPFWDIWPSGAKKPRPFLPGEFFYKSMGGLAFGDGKELDTKRPAVPAFSEVYLLGLYGTLRDKGKDVLGPEFKITLKPSSGNTNSMDEFPIPAWTRSTMTPNENGEYLGSPIVALESRDDHLASGSSGSIPDGIIMCVGTMYPE